MKTEIKLPELGENIETAEVLSVLVSAGETVEKDQPLIELETDKATAEVPAENGGVVKEILVETGQEIKVGQTIVILETGDGAAAAEEPAPEAESEPEPEPEPKKTKEPEAAEKSEETEKTEKSEKTEKRASPKKSKEPEAPAKKPAPSKPEPDAEKEPAREPALRLVNTGATPPADLGDVAPAAPSIRRLARELGIDVSKVPGSGPGGRISDEDVMAYARKLISRVQEAETSGGSAPAAGPSIPELPDFSVWGEVEREPATKIRRLTAQNMSLSWNVIPHVTQFDRADITDLEDWRKKYGKKAEAAGGKLTVTSVAVKVVASALKVFPKFNASYDAREEEIVTKKYVNLGVAVDTDRGLLVPVIRGADRKNIVEIASELGDLAERARDHKIKADELQGANLNISNLGGLGTTYFSPIVSWPQVAVIGIGRATVEAVHRDGNFVPRILLPLAVSYDHRIIDGADAARFLRWIAEALEQPLLVALEG